MENSSNVFVDTQKENIYQTKRNQQDDDKSLSDTKLSIRKFFNELVRRSEGDYSNDTALQATMMITPDEVLSKINEDGGKEPHLVASFNLIKKQLNSTNYFVNSVTPAEMGSNITDEENILHLQSILIRIIAAKNEMSVLCYGGKLPVSDYQLTSFQALLDELHDVREENHYNDVKICIILTKSDIAVEEHSLDEEHYKYVTSLVQNAINKKSIINH